MKMLIRRHLEPLLWASFVILILGFAVAFVTSRPVDEESAPEVSSLETFIPQGHLLIPIEVANADRLEGVLGSHGIVDLYELPVERGARSKLVGRRLRLLRAPLNPQAFAVLLRENEVERFLGTQGPYLASLRSSHEESHEVAKAPKTRAIEYHTETP